MNLKVVNIGVLVIICLLFSTITFIPQTQGKQMMDHISEIEKSTNILEKSSFIEYINLFGGFFKWLIEVITSLIEIINQVQLIIGLIRVIINSIQVLISAIPQLFTMISNFIDLLTNRPQNMVLVM